MSTSIRKKPRDTFHHGDLNAALRKAALSFVARHGVEGFSLREVARAVGVSPSATYRHFADRAALLTAVAADGFTLLGVQMEKAIAGSAPRSSKDRPAEGEAALRAAVGAYVGFAAAHPDHFRVMFGPYGVGGNLAEVLRLRAPDRPTAIEQLRSVVALLVAAGGVDERDVEDAVAFVWTTAHGLAWLLMDGALAGAIDKPVDALALSVTERIVRGVQTERLSPRAR